MKTDFGTKKAETLKLEYTFNPCTYYKESMNIFWVPKIDSVEAKDKVDRQEQCMIHAQTKRIQNLLLLEK